jgi:nucleotidyltransferase/DNA polymerase involved in DNA repair
VLAKLGTDRVEPNGCFVVRDHVELLRDLVKLRSLHGIGDRTSPKLAEEGVVCLHDDWDLGLKADAELQCVLGPGLGKKIPGLCRREDDRPVQATKRKTIGAEVCSVFPAIFFQSYRPRVAMLATPSH